MNKRIKIVICVALIVAISIAIGIFAFVILRPQLAEPEEPERYGLRVALGLTNRTYQNTIYRTVWVTMVNNYPEPVNVSRVELIYLPNETLGLICMHAFCSFDNPSEERLAFFYLLLEDPNVRIEVETEEAIYIYHPLADAIYVKPTSIEEK